MKFREFFEKNRAMLQLGYGIILVILIPTLIVLNSFFIINKYNRGIDEILRKQALSIGRTIANLMKSDLPWEYYIQVKLDALMDANIGIQEISVMYPDDGGFKIVASSNKDLINQKTNSSYYKIAWREPDNTGWATDSWNLANAGLENSQENRLKNKERFWLVATPMRDANDKKTALLSIKLSSEIVDELTRYNQSNSIYMLIITVFIALLFLLAAVRLWDYVLLYAKIKELDKMKDEFISMASHELKTPISAIKGYSSLLLDEKINKNREKTLKSLKIIGSSADRLMQLVEDLLSVSRIEQKKISLRPRPMSIDGLINETISELSIKAEEKKLNLLFTPHKTPLPKLNIDPLRFKEIMLNLISNAIKYTPKGSIEIATRERYDGKVLEIIVKDTGIGMSGKDRERLFKKFYRVKNEKTKNINGTGLGLWITKQLVEMMHGVIEIESIENIGTKATLQFPIIKKS